MAKPYTIEKQGNWWVILLRGYNYSRWKVKGIAEWHCNELNKALEDQNGS